MKIKDSVIDAQNVQLQPNLLRNTDNTNDASTSEKKTKSNLIRPSKWINTIKRKSLPSQQRNISVLNDTFHQVLETDASKNTTPKTPRRISANTFLPKRYSSYNTNTTDTPLFKPLVSPRKVVTETIDENKPITYSKVRSSNRSDASVTSTINSDSHSGINSSSHSDKSAISKSMDVFKKTFTLFTDSNVSSLIPEHEESFDEFDDTLTDEGGSLRRTFSYTDADRRRVISFVMADNGVEKDIPIPISAQQEKGTSLFIAKSNSSTRQRSKTIDALDNPLLENAESTGVLSSIANFVKLNKSSSTASLRTNANSITDPSTKLEVLEISEDDTPENLLQKVLENYPVLFVCEILSLNDNVCTKQAMSIYIQKYFDFKDEPLDISLRKFFMLNNLPKETQQIDRVVYEFSKRYHECNPNIGFDSDTVYILTYSIIMVHTDKFNPNNKRKMTRYEFVQNVDHALKSNNDNSVNKHSTIILKEILGYYYDNITYCPLIKISPEQSATVLDSLINENAVLPYPLVSFLNNASSATDFTRSISSAASTSTTISRSGSQLAISAAPHIRKKSSSFLWTAGCISCDPYDYIVKNDPNSLQSMKLLNDENDAISISYDNPFLSLNGETQLESKFPSMKMVDMELKYFRDNAEVALDKDQLLKIWQNIKGEAVDFVLKIDKLSGSFLIHDNTEVNSLNESTGKEYYISKVIKVGILHRQEPLLNTSHTTQTISVPAPFPKPIDALTSDPEILNNKKNLVWKPYFAILTASGIYMFDDVSTFKMKSVFTDAKNKTIVIEPATPKHGIFKDFKNKELLETNTPIETIGFTPFSYFRSEKIAPHKSFKPALSLGPDSFAIRKFQNLEYDEIVNQPFSSKGTRLNLSAENDMKSFSKSIGNSDCTSKNEISEFASKRATNCTFFIYDKKFKNMYMVATPTELSSWIHSINSVNASNNTNHNVHPIDLSLFGKNKSDKMHSKYYEISLKRNIKDDEVELFNHSNNSNESFRKRSMTSDQCDIVDLTRSKTNSLSSTDGETTMSNESNLADSKCKSTLYEKFQSYLDSASLNENIEINNFRHYDLLSHLHGIQNLKLTMPLEKRTKQELLYSAKIMAVKLEWIWYEKCRSQAIALITECMNDLTN